MTEATQLGMLRSVLGRRSLSRLSALCLIFAAFGCNSGTETGNPSLTGSLSYTGYSSAPADYGVGEPGQIARVDAAWFELDRVSSEDCASGNAFEIAPLGVGDHAAGNHNVLSFEANAGAVCGLKVPFLEVEAAPSGAPSALSGHTLLLRGALADGTPFTIISDARPTVELLAVDGSFELAADDADLLLAFDFAAWLKDVDFGAAARNADDEIVITSRENSELLAVFDARVASGIALYRDRDADGVVDRDPELLAEPR